MLYDASVSKDGTVTMGNGYVSVLASIVVEPPLTDVVGADNYVRAGQSACWYSWMMPARRSRRRMCRCVIVAGSVIGSGSGCNGLEFEMPR